MVGEVMVVRGLRRGSLLLWGGALELLRGLLRGTQGAEEFLEPLLAHVPGGIGEVAPVLGQLK